MTSCPDLANSSNFFLDLKEKWTLPEVALTPFSPIHEIRHIIAFRTYLCELIYQAVQYFPDIIEYTITCKNNAGTVSIVLNDSENGPNVGTVNTQCGAFYISRLQMTKIYSANRTPVPDHRKINMIVDCILNGEREPIVKTSWKINNKF